MQCCSLIGMQKLFKIFVIEYIIGYMIYILINKKGELLTRVIKMED